MEEVVTDIVSKPIEALASMAFKKIKFAVSKDLDSTIEQLGDFFCFIDATLRNLDPFESSNNIERLKKERLQLIHAELNHFFTKLAARTGVQSKVMGSRGFTFDVCSFLSSPKQLVLRFKYAAKVNDLTSKLKSLASVNELCKKLAIDPSGNQDRRTSGEDTSPFPVSDVFIGRDTDKENVINLLCNHSVVAIAGVGGQGKTTLAQYVCQDDRIKGSFDKLLWVYVTPQSSVNEIFQKIITSATGNKSDYCGSQQLHQQVFQAIGGKCLLVLDNVYYSKNLSIDIAALNAILQQGGFWHNGSKVLITTRSKAVAKRMDATKQYELRDLAEDDCWILLRHYAIKHEEEKECGVEEIGKEIARMCPKMPLVLKTIGCYLADRDYKSQWEHFRNELASNPTLYIEQQDKIKQILKLCYDQLDYNLKRCAAFCSLFPKGHVYNKNCMVRYWIALGFVESRDGMSLQDVGDACVLELKQRAFFEEAGNFEDFKMHDVMHDLMLLIGKDKHQMIDSKTKNIVEGVCHISLNKHDLNWNILLSSISGKQTLESILLVSSAWDKHVKGMPLRSGIKKLLSACPKLKVLEIYDQGIGKIPRSIGELTLVRHLNMSGNPFYKLPNEITKMVNLLTLDLSWCNNLRELPRDMGKLVKLRHLWITGCGLLTCMPEGFGNLRELETLDEFVVGGESSSRGSKGKGGAKLEELGHLKNLTGELCIRVAGESKYIVSKAGNAHLELEAKLSRLQIRFEKKGEEDEKFLEGIQLSGENWKEVSIQNYGGKKLPAWMADDQFHKRFPKLYSFVLGRTFTFPSGADHDKDEFMKFVVEGNEDELGEWVQRYSRIKEHLKMGLIKLEFTTSRDGLTLTHVKKDVTLHNVRCWVKGELARRSSSGVGQRQPAILLKSCFPNLTQLRLWDIPELEFLPEEFRDISSLKELDIWECGKLKAIPDWIDTLSSLTSLFILNCPELKVLPDSICSLTSLFSIKLKGCRGLELLPHQISKLPKFCDLHIDKCSKALYEKYTNPTGEYWPHLQHLQFVTIQSSEGDHFDHCFNNSLDEISSTNPEKKKEISSTPSVPISKIQWDLVEKTLLQELGMEQTNRYNPNRKMVQSNGDRGNNTSTAVVVVVVLVVVVLVVIYYLYV